MAFKTFDRKVYFALESAEGTREVPNTNTGYIETTEPTFSVTNRVFERNPTRMSISPVPALIPGTGSASGAASATIEFTFSVELSGSGTIGTAPRWGALLQACGMNQVEVSSMSSDGTLAGGSFTPKVLRNYENFSSSGATTYASLAQTGRFIGDHFYDDPTVYYHADASGSTAPVSGNNLVGQISNMYATTDASPLSTAGIAWVLTSSTNLGGAANSSLTLQLPINSNGDYVEGIGCRGNVEFAFVSGDRVMMNFTFTGRFNQYAEGGSFAPTAEGRPLPPSFIGVSLGISESTYGSTDAATYDNTIFNSMTIGLNNDLTVRESVSAASGYQVAYITGRSPSMTFNPDAVRDFTTNPAADLWDRFLSGETTRGRLKVGTALDSVGNGNTFVFKFPAAQFTGLTEGNRDEVVVWDSTTTLTGGDYGSSVQQTDTSGDGLLDHADSTVTDSRLGTNNEFVFYQL